MNATTLLGRIAVLQESKAQRPADARATWRRVLGVESGSMTTLAEVERLSTSLGRQRELMPLYEELASKKSHANTWAPPPSSSRGPRGPGLAPGRPGGCHPHLAAHPGARSFGNHETARPAVEALGAPLRPRSATSRGFVEVLRMRPMGHRGQRAGGDPAARGGDRGEVAGDPPPPP